METLDEKSMLAHFDAVLKLLSGHSCEERVAGLLISSKTLVKLKDSMNDAQVEEVLSRIITAVTPRFVVRMLGTSVDATGGQMADTAEQVLRVAAGYPALASRFIPYTAKIIDQLIVKKTVHLHSMDIIYSLSRLDSRIGTSAAEAALGCISNPSSDQAQPPDIRDVVECVSLTAAAAGAGDTPSVSPAIALKMRSVIVQCLHGAADMRTREHTYESLSYLFRTISPSWTVESESAGAGAGKREKPGTFASFLGIMVCGDLRIFFEENLSVFYASCPGEKEEGESTVISTVDVDYTDRYQNRISMCFSILDTVLELLIGDLSDPSEQEPLWSTLPATALISIQKAVHSSVNDLLDFVKEAHSMVSKNIEYVGSDVGRDYKKKYLTFVVERALMTVVKWSLEDPELLQLLATRTTEFISFSEVKTTIPSSTSAFNILNMCKRSVEEDMNVHSQEKAGVDVFQSLLPALLEIVSESPFLSPADDGVAAELWDDDTMNMLNSSELLSRLFVLVTETALLFSESVTTSISSRSYNYEEILVTCGMAGELISMLGKMCVRANCQFSFDTMSILSFSKEWNLMVSSINKMGSKCNVLIADTDTMCDEKDASAINAKYKGVKKLYKGIAKIGIIFNSRN
jgi:hypothetical protein